MYVRVIRSRRMYCHKEKGLWFRKKPMDLCACESETCEHRVGTDVNVIVMSDVLYGIGLLSHQMGTFALCCLL